MPSTVLQASDVVVDREGHPWPDTDHPGNLASCTEVRVYRRCMTDVDDVWVPEACTLPTVDRPLRLSEFDDLFATSLQELSRISPTVLRWSFDPAAEEAARDLTARETECCSFFTFGFSST